MTASPAARRDETAERPRLLLVDDEENILHALHRLLRKQYEVHTTTSPEEALDRVREQSYAVLLSDQRMPGMDGTELMARAREHAPDTIRIILTGYADIHAVIRAINEGAIYRFLTKPWNDDELQATLRQAVAQYELVQENQRLLSLTEEQNQKLEAFNRTLRQKVMERTRQVTELNQSLTKSFRGTIEVLSQLADMHSPALSKHAKRVTALACMIGERLRLGSEQLFQLEVAATLHDIGKITMDPNLLKQPYAQMKAHDRAVLMTHATRGAALVQMIPNLEEAARYVRHHHEHYGGGGFPKRLEGNQIPLGSRIIAVADAFDNALNGRSSFQKTTPEQALKYVRDNTPTLFDPYLVDILITCILQENRPINHAMEVEVGLFDLKPGMVLARDVRSIRGILLLEKHQVLDEGFINRLHAYHETEPIIDGILVYRNQTAATDARPAPADVPPAAGPPPVLLSR
ncbi:response regulator [Rhodocaloribacter litoris]|uniref:HD domain-containing phosphohydrolase n=1 Tax=Rhodocaloribacter litoris TaxID=2558931 RepID=UPI00141DD1E1|nr:HD domain-containing phosphohydrolase [Rhodocaloribacter litoris]QXD16385.1 response regulator [Rhodocaloribacter litoris]